MNPSVKKADTGSQERLASFTPGPWFPKHGNRTTLLRGVYADSGRCVIRFNGIAAPTTDEGQANARLIAAAPDLLKACEAALEENQTGDNSHTVAALLHNAIQKARGE